MEIKIPAIGESIVEATIAQWHKQSGDQVAKDELLCELETDKITLEIHAEVAGVLKIEAEEGQTVKVGAVIARLVESDAAAETPPPVEASPKETSPAPATVKIQTAPPAPTKAENPTPPPPPQPAAEEPEGRVTRRPMSPIRRKIAERLLAARQQTAMATTFNEADLSRIVELRRKHGENFQQRHGVKLGLLPFFIKACAEALQEFPEVNARIDGNDIVYQHFYDIGIAVAAEMGLLVPVIREVPCRDFADLQKTLDDFAARAKVSRIELAELDGGTFSISNGGVYGSLLSTPLLNPPQSAILGLHAIQDRPVARDGQVVIRPMMNLALSYDHRLIDGRQAVEFLLRIKTMVEEPEEMLLEL